MNGRDPGREPESRRRRGRILARSPSDSQRDSKRGADDASLVAWVAVSRAAGKRHGLWAAVREFGGAEALVAASLEERAARLPGKLARALRIDLGAAEAVFEDARRIGVRVLAAGAEDFPTELRDIPDPPLVLYLRGQLPEGPRVAIVGSRLASANGRRFARELGSAASRAGFPVVSGLAYGIDVEAHHGAREGAAGTLIVLASGVDRPSPRAHVRLAEACLADGGGWLSEHPPGARALPHHFPERNRLISGLSKVTAIVEAREKSGSLWTAEHALEQGRDVLAAPGPVGQDAFRGSNRLLYDGAGMLLETRDLLDALQGFVSPGEEAPAPAIPPEIGGLAGQILAQLAAGPCDVDALSRALAVESPALAHALLELELQGEIRRSGAVVARARG